MAKDQKRKRVAFTVGGGGKSHARKKTGGQRMVSPERIICITEDESGTWLRHEYERADIQTSESLAALVAQSGDVLIELTPVAFEAALKGQDQAHRGSKVAVNVDFLTILPDQDKRGTVIAVDGVERNVVVQETAAQIKALINGI